MPTPTPGITPEAFNTSVDGFIASLQQAKALAAADFNKTPLNLKDVRDKLNAINLDLNKFIKTVHGDEALEVLPPH